MIQYKEINYFGAKVEVSPNGDIKFNGVKRNIYYNKDGYSVVSIKTDKGWRSARVARLVAIAYIPNPLNLPEVNHKDFNRQNSNVENLEWVTRKENVNYSEHHFPNYSGENNPNYGNKKLSKRYAEDKEYAKEKQSRKGLQNGRCRKIKLFQNNIFLKEFNYIVECCEYLKEKLNLKSSLTTIRTGIDKSVRFNKPYKKEFTFIKE